MSLTAPNSTSLSINNNIKGNYIGIGADGISTLTGSNQFSGIRIDGAINNTIGGVLPNEGNLISGNYGLSAISQCSGITLANNAQNNYILGNVIGTTVNGTQVASQQHQDWGIEINNSQNNIIGGNTPAARNIISGNRTLPGGALTGKSCGIYMYGNSCTGNSIQGNYIGVAANGMDFIQSSGQKTGIDIFLAKNNIIGGSGPGEGNVISGNIYNGILLEGNAQFNVASGNIIGLQKDAQTIVTTALYDEQDFGVTIEQGANNTIGGIIAGSRNVISGNLNGLKIRGNGTIGNSVLGNFIGIAGDGISPVTANIQNIGIFMQYANNNYIGGRTSGSANIIAYNTTRGILNSSNGTGNGRLNKFSCNPIFGNPIYAIENTSNGNDMKLKPTILSAYSDSIIGTSAPLDTVEIFSNTALSCQDAYTYRGYAKADASGNWAFPSSFSIGDKILATGTATNNNTSDFACATISCPSVNIIGNTILCNGNSTSLTASGGVSYVWGPETFTTSTASFSVAGTKTLTTTYGSSCITTTTINVTDLTLGSPGNIDGPINICQGQTGLSYSVPAITNATSYSWSLPAGATISSGINTNSITVNYSSIATSGNIIVIGNNSCGNSSASNSFSIVANPLPNITISGNSTICNGDTVILTASGASTYSWSAGSSVSTQTFTPNSNTTVSITGNDSNNCTNTATINVSVNSLPILTINGASSVCNGNSLILTANGASTYSWSSGSSLSTVTLTPTANTTYSITGTDSNGCTNTTVTSITVNPLPDVSITSAANSINANQNGATYQWVDCNNNYSIIASETNQSYIANISGDYAVIVTNNGCTDTSLCANILITNISETNDLNNITLFPNPLISYTTIMFTESQKNVTIKIVDLLGKNLRTINFTGKNCVIEKENIPAGTYFLEIKTENGVFYKKIIIGV